jgi:hypothetical protein
MSRHLEREQPPKESYQFHELIELDLPQLKNRIEAFRQRALEADRVVITIICCDSRVVMPEQLVEVQTGKGSEQVLFIPVPTIGSGAPSRSRLRSVYQQVTEGWQVDPKKVAFLMTQHGDSQEINDLDAGIPDVTHISCGLRKFFNQESRALSRLRQLLIAWSFRFKAEKGDKTLAPDRMTLAQLRSEVPHIMAEVDRLHQATGKLGLRVPRRLLIRAAYRNNHSDLELNEFNVFEKVMSYLQDPEYASSRSDLKAGHATYDHQQKSLQFDNPEANLGWSKTVRLPDLAPRTDRFQDPQFCFVSFGHQAIPLAVRQLMPHLCGIGSEQYQPPADNAFRTVASIPTVPTLLCAMAESAYAVLHRVHPHAGDPNFNHLQKLLIICDDDQYVDVVQQLIHDQEFQEEYLPMLTKLQPEGLHVINLRLDKPEMKPEHVVISY